MLDYIKSRTRDFKNAGLGSLRWRRKTEEFERFITRYDTHKENPDEFKGNAAVIVQPWGLTDVPFYSIAMGLLLAKKGNKVTFILDDKPFGDSPRSYNMVLKCLEQILAGLSGKHKVQKLSKCNIKYSEKDTNLSEEVKRLSDLNTIWFKKGETLALGMNEYKKLVQSQLNDTSLYISSFLSDRQYNYIFIPGGIYGSSGLWYYIAREKGIRVSSFDSGSGVVLLAADGIAAQLHDIPRSFAMLKSRPEFEAEKPFVVEMAQAEIKKRQAGKDRFAYQVTQATQKGMNFDNGVLIALNSSWDSAALGLHAVFENTTEWIIETTRWLLDNTDVPIIIRQHPVERLAIGRSSDDYTNLLESNFGENSRIHFIAAADPVNSYDLMNTVNTVIVYTSTIGVEAAIRGKVVIMPSKSYYSTLGFVWNADDRNIYFDHLSKAIHGQYAVDKEMINDALCCYYITQCCNWIPTTFSPEGFSKWSKYTLEDLFNDEMVQIKLKSLEKNIPVSLLHHDLNMRHLAGK